MDTILTVLALTTGVAALIYITWSLVEPGRF